MVFMVIVNKVVYQIYLSGRERAYCYCLHFLPISAMFDTVSWDGSRIILVNLLGTGDFIFIFLLLMHLTNCTLQLSHIESTPCSLRNIAKCCYMYSTSMYTSSTIKTYYLQREFVLAIDMRFHFP